MSVSVPSNDNSVYLSSRNIPPKITTDLQQVDNQNEEVSHSQVQWAQRHIDLPGAVVTANPKVNPAELFSRLHLNAMPHPELYHLYLRDHEGTAYRLVRDPHTLTTKFIRLYANETLLNYVTIMDPPSSKAAKETYVSPRSSFSKYEEKRRPRAASSTSYPRGVHTYHIEMGNREKIELQCGHGVPHADTLKYDGGVISTVDPENFVPQHIKYNYPIREGLEDDLRRQGLNYKEISIYHNKCYYSVTARINKKDEKLTVPIPEGFLFFTFNNNSEVICTYYFPNLVDYKKLIPNGRKYEYFYDLYKVQDLSEWFLTPEVTLGLVDAHQQKVDLARRLAERILLFSNRLFSKFSEEQMPPKARVALCTTLLEWNMETAATLEFLSLEHQLRLVHFYLESRRKFWELDDRHEDEKRWALDQFLNDRTISPVAQKMVNFLAAHLNFQGLQAQLQEIVNQFEEIYKNAPHFWQLPDLIKQIITFTCKGNVYEFNLIEIFPQDISKVKELIGGADNYNTDRARHILSVIDARAREKHSVSIMEKLHMMRLYRDELPDKETHCYWENTLLNPGMKISLLECRRIVDYYAYRNMEEEKIFWLEKFVSYVQENPTVENFVEIAGWCFNGRSSFLQNMGEQSDPMRPSNMLALQIYKALSHLFPGDYGKRFIDRIDSLQEGLGLYQQDCLGVGKANILSSSLLEPLIEGRTGQMLKQLSEIFLEQIRKRALFPS